MLIDSHCHLDFPDLATKREAVLARAEGAGVGLMLTVSTRVRRFSDLLDIVEPHGNVYCSIGTHPHHAAEERDITLEEIVKFTRHPKVVAIGEAGLDYHYDNSPREDQERGFRTHIAAARQTGLPLVIHARDADDDIAGILEEETARGAFPFVLHCFTGGPELARRGLALGGYVSFSGVVTFKNSEALRDIAREVPLDRLLVETDAPYLAPEPLRGRTNEPANVVHTAARLAAVRGHQRGRSRQSHHRKLLSPVQEGAAFGGVHPRFMTLKLTILGCGTSGGVPRVGNIWGACDPSNPKNRRRRCSVLVQKEGGEGTTNVLVDTAPDLREQLLDAGVGWLDGVLFTHDHADHTHGIDDLRMVSYNGRRRVAVYLRPADGAAAQAALRLLLQYVGKWRVSADTRRPPNRAWRTCENSRSGRRHRGLAVPPASRLRRDARFSLRRHRLFA